MKYIIITVLVLITAIVVSQFYISRGTNDTNTIEFETLAYKNGYQIRKYSEMTVASTELDNSSYSRVSSQGFRKIASYIFGGNSSSEQIAMTSPVQMEMGSKTTMSFFMPGNKDAKDLPTPNLKDVYINVQPSKTVAVIEFSGWASDKVLEQQFNLLKEKLDAELIAYEDSFSFLGYNPPYQLFNRKNEVTIPLITFQKRISSIN